MLIVLTPSSFTTPSQFKSHAIATSMALDTAEDELELTIQIIKPQPNSGSGPKYQHISSQGATISDCIEKLEMQLGRIIGLGHCATMVISDDVCTKYNLLYTLDDLIRGNELGTNTLLIHTMDKAKDILTSSAAEENNTQDLLMDITQLNQQLYSTKTDLFSFYNNSISPHSTAIMLSLDINNDAQQGQSNSESGAQGAASGSTSATSDSTSNSSNSSGQQSKSIKSQGDISIFVDGNLVDTLSYQELKGFNWLDSKTKRNLFKLENISNEELTNATMELVNLGQNIKLETSITNNTPLIYAKVDVRAKIFKIQDANNAILTNQISYIDKTIQSAFKELVQKEVDDSIKLSKEKNFDKLNFYHLFEKNHYKEWQQYLANLDDPDNYMQGIQVYVDASITENAQ